MMLSRVAGSLYWMGRYLERAENVSRILFVTAEDASDLEGLDEARARSEWEDLRQAIPGWDPPDLGAEPERRTITCIESLLLDRQSPVSVRTAVGRARENARGVREALTRVMPVPRMLVVSASTGEGIEAWSGWLQALRARGVLPPADAAGETVLAAMRSGAVGESQDTGHERRRARGGIR